MKLTHLASAAVVAVVVGIGAYVRLGAAPAAPDVAYTLLDGTRSSFAQLRGKVVLVNFWATSCASCIHEMPQVVATYDKYKTDGYDTIAVAMSYDRPAAVAQFAATRKLSFPVAIDSSGAIAASFGDVKLTPTSMLIDKRGKIVMRYDGEPDFAALHQLIEKLLAQA